ncbi:SDR family NAD(P)-dependent oxidoreductase [Flavobacterium ardleyense]|uniref:SDR family NAD(P)-dependent oxidoreductase n=1 Tax=Flavobacterium ardleyense TaxID=2038737 RepID=UPI00298D5F2A|nr:SDR family oxidoreductase [Flavobacterium ardleyense]
MANYFIVGASSGIGKQLATQLSEAGHKVFGTFNKTAVSENISNVEYHSMDVLAEVNVDFLPETIDALIYCPGSINLKPFTRIKVADFLSDFDLQVGGAVKVIQAVLPRLKAAEHSSIVLFSTVAVQTGLPFHTQVAASKGAIEGLTKSLAAEFAPKIRVNCIAPSLTDTPLAAMLLNNDQKKDANAERHPLKRIGRTEDIANMAEFLISDKAAWITGQIMHVDGGMSTVKS